MKLQIVRITKDFADRPSLHGEYQPGAFAQESSKHRMIQVRDRLIESGDSKSQRRRTRPQSVNLWKDKPHPVRLFPPSREFRARLLVDGCLGLDKALEIKRGLERQFKPLLLEKKLLVHGLVATAERP